MSTTTGKSANNISTNTLKPDFRFFDAFSSIVHKIESEQLGSILKAADQMADAVEEDRLIYIFGGGGHTTLVMQELFWRAGGLANLCPMIDFSIHPVIPAYMYLTHERMHGIGDALVDYYGVGKNDLVLVFHSYGINPPTIDCAMESRKRGATVIGISSSDWKAKIPKDFPVRHETGSHLSDVSDIFIDNYVPYGDTVIEVEGFHSPITGISSTVDFYIAHRLEMECVKACVARGIEAPVWTSANIPGGDEKNKALRQKYNSRVKFL